MVSNQEKIWDKLYSSKLNWHFENSFQGHIKGKKVLEIGVGTGKTLRSLIKKQPKEVIAIDFSARAVKECKKLESDKIKILKADVLNMPFEKGKFEVVVCNYTLNNLLEKDRGKAIDEIRRVLALKGKVYFEDFGNGDFRQEKGKEIEKNTFSKENGLICHFFEESEILDLFKGFKKINVKTKTFKPFRALNKERKIITAIIE